jgi:hypothetical protein
MNNQNHTTQQRLINNSGAAQLHIPERNLKRFKIAYYLSTAAQMVFSIIIFVFFIKNDWQLEVKEIDKYFEGSSAKDDITFVYGIINATTYMAFFIPFLSNGWRLYYNKKWLNFTDTNLNWVNCQTFYIFYSFIPSILASIARGSNPEIFHEVFVYLELLPALLLGIAIATIALILVMQCFCATAGGTQEVGRSYQGNTTTVYYTHVNSGNPMEGTTCKLVKKICSISFMISVFCGFIISFAIVICINNPLVKTWCIIEKIINIVLIVMIYKNKKYLATLSVQNISSSTNLYPAPQQNMRV